MRKFWIKSGDCRTVTAPLTQTNLQEAGHSMIGAPMHGFESAEMFASLQRLRDVAASLPKRYTRWADVEAEIEEICALHQSDWGARIPSLHSETLVFLIRLIRRIDEVVCGRLVTELARRIHFIAQEVLRDFDPIQTETILMEVGKQVLTLILTETDTPSRQAEVLEAIFAKAVRRRTITLARMFQRTVHGRISLFPAGAGDDEDDAEEIERPIESAPDSRPGPEANLIEAQREGKRKRLRALAHKVVTNRQNLEALLLHYFEGLPVASKLGMPSVAGTLNITENQAWYCVRIALKQMREALGGTQ